MKAARKADPSIEVIILTGFASVDSAITAIRDGAFHYVTKPIKPQIVRTRVRLHLQNALHIQFLERLLDKTTSNLENARAEARTLLQMAGLTDDA